MNELHIEKKTVSGSNVSEVCSHLSRDGGKEGGL